MNLPPRHLALKPIDQKGRTALALDTGIEADSIEGMRLVKASRGTGWLYHEGNLLPWTTKGVVQEAKRLLVWGEVEVVPEGETPAAWPAGAEGRTFLLALVRAWTARAQSAEPLSSFSASAVVPLRTAGGWSFVFLPAELRGVLDSLQPLSDRLAWESIRHPDAAGAASWAFTSAALAWSLVEDLPWVQEDDAHLRQEVRDLKRTLSPLELPEGPEPETLKLWHDSLTGRGGTPALWKQWAAGNPVWSGTPSGRSRTAVAAKRIRRRSGAAFWRRRGTVTTALAVGALVLLSIVGSVVWGIVKPDPTDTWTPQQVVEGYYSGMSALNSELMRKLTSFDKSKQPDLGHDEDEVSNLFVIRQIRTAYEHQSPVVSAEDWEKQGRPELTSGQVLYGPTGLDFSNEGRQWTVRYRKWVSESSQGTKPTAVAADLVDHVVVSKTGRGWKISALQRDRQLLP